MKIVGNLGISGRVLKRIPKGFPRGIFKTISGQILNRISGDIRVESGTILGGICRKKNIKRNPWEIPEGIPEEGKVEEFIHGRNSEELLREFQTESLKESLNNSREKIIIKLYLK